MYKYYFKIKKNNVEFEFSTDDLKSFDEKVLNWVKNICEKEKNEAKKGFIDVTKIVNFDELKPTQTPVQNFEEILEQQSMFEHKDVKEKITFDNDLLNLINEKKPKDIFQTFMVCAYYFSNRIQHHAFTLKEINMRLFPVKQEAVTFQTIQDALDNNFIEVVPDLTGISNYIRYAISIEGENYVNNNFK